MTIHLPSELESTVRAEVHNGHFASPDDMVAEAVREYFRQHRQCTQADAQGATKPLNSPNDLIEAELADQEIHRRLFDAGLLSEIKPPIRDMMPYRDRRPIPIQGEPLSETVIRERR